MVYLPHWPIPGSFGNAKINFEEVFVRMNSVLTKLGDPHKKLSPSIHVTGTNGKGSSCAFLAKILQENDCRVNLYTSPHIHNCNERIILNGSEICDSRFYKIIEKVRIATKQHSLTFFEALTIAAILAFYESKSDFNIFEVGVGARIDATNIVENRAATIITPISYDHEEYLGDNIAKIAFEKAHILRPDTPLILGPQPQEALQIIDLIAKDQGAAIVSYNKDFSIEINEDQSFNFSSKKRNINNIPAPSLAGKHQYINASIAIAAALSLENIRLSDEKIKNAVETTKWQNRIEKVKNGLNKFITKDSEIYIDSAHNVSGAYALTNWLEEESALDKGTAKNIAILGFSRTKCKASFLKLINNVCEELIATRAQGESDPETSSAIKDIGNASDIKITEKEDLLEAFHYLSKKYPRQKLRIIICGSIHLARDLRKFGGY